jgi:hypothetical protein
MVCRSAASPTQLESVIVNPKRTASVVRFFVLSARSVEPA